MYLSAFAPSRCYILAITASFIYSPTQKYFLRKTSHGDGRVLHSCFRVFSPLPVVLGKYFTVRAPWDDGRVGTSEPSSDI